MMARAHGVEHAFDLVERVVDVDEPLEHGALEPDAPASLKQVVHMLLARDELGLRALDAALEREHGRAHLLERVLDASATQAEREADKVLVVVVDDLHQARAQLAQVRAQLGVVQQQ